jgi:hypothetical protein
VAFTIDRDGDIKVTGVWNQTDVEMILSFAVPFLCGLLTFSDSWFSHPDLEKIITVHGLFICAMKASMPLKAPYCNVIITSFCNLDWCFSDCDSENTCSRDIHNFL